MKIGFATIAAIVALASASSAGADPLRVYYTGSNSGVADLEITTGTTLNSFGGYDVLTVSGTVNGEVVTGLAPINPPGFFTNNTYYDANPVFDSYGIGFLTATKSYNLLADWVDSYYLFGYNGSTYSNSFGSVTVTAVAVPEPASWALMIGGFGLMGAAMRKRLKVSTIVSYA